MNVQGAAYTPQQILPNPTFYATQNKATLSPGQVIQIQSLTVTVERFLGQGSFAHVYLVNTPTPVNGTTQHVLKRMLVADNVMLQDVKKEVDIMRTLRGHANIVNFIDSAWSRLQVGRYEVFILMEFCAGGGIVDLMNRRLKERLTEEEILQIFADVCEGLAAMHTLQPALLHRDLRIENIVQASETSYKLCDFGSATAVTKPPTTAAEMSALERDLNRHTNLQYRAPEMVEPSLRRPIDEKSDVWALGVLLYKLCYYTTPFEEHGPLAILHVQYKIPPYPLYSQRMIGLITSILREHGTQRPTVFEILDSVHRIRGTKSRHAYTPRPQPPSPGVPRSPGDTVPFRSAGRAESNQQGTTSRSSPTSSSSSSNPSIQPYQQLTTFQASNMPPSAAAQSRFTITIPVATAPNRRPIVIPRGGNMMELKFDGETKGSQQHYSVEYDPLGPGPPPSSQLLMTQRTPSPSAVPQRDWLTDDDIVLQPMAKASTGSLQSRMSIPDAPYVDPNIRRFKHQKEPSRDLIRFSESSEPSQTPAQNAYNRVVHFFPPMDPFERRHSPSSGSDSEKETDAPRPQVPQKRFSSSKGRPVQLSLDRMRPQSPFVSPGNSNQMSYLKNSPPDSVPVPSPNSNSSAPLNRLRRTSISDMVSRYEALSVVSSTTSGSTTSNESGPTSPKQKLVIGTKPPALRSGLQNNMVSPTGNAFFFPPIDSSTLQQDPVKMNAPVKMRTSPLLFKPMEFPTEVSATYGSVSREQESPATSQGPPQRLHLPIADRGRSVSPGGSQTGTVSDTHEHILLVSPRPRVTPYAFENYPEPTLARARAPPIGQSPSPKKAYIGVGKLIDQWQKKTEEAEGKGRTGMKPTGPRQLQRPLAQSPSPEQTYEGVGKLVDQWLKKMEEDDETVVTSQTAEAGGEGLEEEERRESERLETRIREQGLKELFQQEQEGLEETRRGQRAKEERIFAEERETHEAWARERGDEMRLEAEGQAQEARLRANSNRIVETLQARNSESTSEVQDIFKHLPMAPDLGGKITIQSHQPVYSGSFSRVYRGEFKQGAQKVAIAIKVLNEIRGAAAKTMQRKLERERRTWGALRHPNILPLYGFVDDEEMFKPHGALVSPWCKYGDAQTYLEKHGASLDTKQRINLWKDVIAGVDHLHSHSPLLIHGDLKPRNVLIDDFGKAQLCDFGLVTILADGNSGMTTTSPYTGTERYLSRELIVGGEEVGPTTASDIYAAGCIGLEFIFSQIPYSSRKNNYRGGIFADIKARLPPATCPADLTPALQFAWARLAQCWDLDPSKRPLASSLLLQLGNWKPDTESDTTPHRAGVEP